MEEKAESLLADAMRLGVSDIHLLPYEDHYELFFRVSTGLSKVSVYSIEKGERLISYFKFLSNMNVGERRKPQSGAVRYRLNGKKIELRLSTIANFRYQESLVIRMLYANPGSEPGLHAFFPAQEAELLELLDHKSGLVLFSGPTGSGKTTTIYHLLRRKYADEPLQIITMEDPVEIEEPLFLQAEVNEAAGITYDLLIRQCLRHHPDILVIGEIRDEETAKMVVRSALTGHLVIATIHAKESFGVLERLRELTISSEQMKQTLLAVVSQRLIAKYCPLCSGKCTIHCSHYQVNEKSAAIYEILAGKELQDHLQNKEDRKRFVTLNDKLRKAYACGYITEKNYLENLV
ncbi:competence type IV pilus ATPase ComGA [Trichococcus alkaliphilus]|uniref:competence type IV pilus ATPase ComGA n=1 Tax=Trichococcus alkaliphilus TaxID=2052943 RepID=UPI0030B8263A